MSRQRYYVGDIVEYWHCIDYSDENYWDDEYVLSQGIIIEVDDNRNRISYLVRDLEWGLENWVYADETGDLHYGHGIISTLSRKQTFYEEEESITWFGELLSKALGLDSHSFSFPYI